MKTLRTPLFIALLICALSLLGISYAKGQNTQSGEELLNKVYNDLSSRRLVKFTTNVTIKGESAAGIGHFIADSESGYVYIKDVSEYKYDKNNIYLYSFISNEYVIKKRKNSSSNILENPFMLLQGASNFSISSPSIEIVDKRRVKSIVLTPLKRSFYKNAKIYLTDSQNPQLVRIELFTNGGDKYQTIVESISAPLSSEQFNSYTIDISKYKGVKTNDLR